MNGFVVDDALALMRDIVKRGSTAYEAFDEACEYVHANKAEREVIKRLYDEGKDTIDE